GDVDPANARVEVYSMKGDKVMMKEMTGFRKQEFTVDGRPTGVYLIRIVSGDFTKTVRLLKQ
ncbi:MAG: T9SS type A sorting domain-containing protein, partial [Bacteroidota bacterium]